MGINLEYVTLLSSLRTRKLLPDRGSVLEFGAQDISADGCAMASHAKRCGLRHDYTSIKTASALYKLFGLSSYTCIDATSEHEALAYDLNTNLRSDYGFTDTFELVTDLGTFEHCFDVASAFRNAHESCKVNGLIIHALPSNCNANHGYYVVQPRMIADLAAANNYEIIDCTFTVDYSPILYQFDMKNYRVYDDRDLMVYVVLKKTEDASFQMPFDSIFSDKNTLSSYQKLYAPSSFASYIKGSWHNIKPSNLEQVPINIQPAPPLQRTLVKQIIDRIGKWK